MLLADPDAPVSETTERFMRAILAAVPIDTIDELHLFAPLRQGTVETGLAVIAARMDQVEQAGEGTTVESVTSTKVDAADNHATDDDAIERDGDAALDTRDDLTAASKPLGDATLDAEPTAQTELPIVEPEPELIPVMDDAPDDSGAEEVATPTDGDADSPYAAEPDAPGPSATASVSGVPFDADSPSPSAGHNRAELSDHARTVVMERHRVYTARYRYTVKGPERGKWDADVRDEADAPLTTVEMVVRGVQRRAGDVSDPVRYSNAQLRHALRFAPPHS